MEKVQSLQCFFRMNRKRGYKSGIHLFGLVASMIGTSFSLGSLIGPIMSGVITQRYGFAWMTTVVSALLVSMVSLSPIP